MSFFVGFYPNKEVCKQIKEVSNGIKSTFDGLNLDVRWSKREDYYISIVYLGENPPFWKMLYFKHKMANFSFKKFDIQFGAIKVGSSKRNKGLIFLEVLEGGDDIRELCLALRKSLRLKQDINLIPKITLGRLNKEMSQQEYSNLVKGISTISKSLKIKDIKFSVDNIEILKA